MAVVIPTLNEAAGLPSLLDDLEPLQAEVVVVDGGSIDHTAELARARGARVVHAGRGRGRQMNAGAAVCSTEWILFLHADSRLSDEAADAIDTFLAAADQRDFAHFAFELDGTRRLHRFIEWGQRLRERSLGAVYGDQGLLVSRTMFARVGGFPDWPIMEDVGVVDRLNRAGTRVALPARLRTSARRYDAEGVIRAWLRNVALMTAFRAGADPARLARWYGPHQSTPPARATEAEATTAPAAGRGVIVFARAPVAGRVKTRLAADVGDVEALRIYRRLAEDTLARLRGGPWRLFVYVDPPTADGLEAVRHWLGDDGITYRPQSTGDLGARMSAAFEKCFACCAEVCIVGTDLPGMGKEWVAEAFDSLAKGDVVLGPSTDGGYYLMALPRPTPALFRDVSWGTDSVLSATLERAREASVHTVLLDPRTDVDTLGDVPEELLAG